MTETLNVANMMCGAYERFHVQQSKCGRVESEPHGQLQTVCVMHKAFNILPGLLQASVWRLVFDSLLEARLCQVPMLTGALRL